MTAFYKSFERWSRFYRDQSAMLLSAGDVIGKRTAGMAAHGLNPDARELREMQTMIAEKQAAMVEGSMAAWAELMRANQAMWLAALRGGTGTASPLDSHLRIVRAAMKPMQTRVAANQKRLAR